jgi:hypothetical protein
MLLHIFIDYGSFSHLKKGIISILLTIQIDSQQFHMSSPICLDSSFDSSSSPSSPSSANSTHLSYSKAFFCKTIYIPIINHEITLTNIRFSCEAYSSTGKSSLIGIGKCTASFLEHGVTKSVSLSKKDSKPTGSISLTLFYYKFPMDIRDFGKDNDFGALERQKRFVREYAFLRSRNQNWKGDRISTWNYTTQKLLDNDESIHLSRKLQSKTNPRPKSPRQTVQRFESPKSRKTVMSVGYTGSGVDWPSLEGANHVDKIQYKLYLAQERRLNLLEKSSELIRQRNSQLRTKQDLLINLKNRQSLRENQLKEMLEEREKSLQRLERKYLQMKYENESYRKHHSQISKNRTKDKIQESIRDFQPLFELIGDCQNGEKVKQKRGKSRSKKQTINKKGKDQHQEVHRGRSESPHFHQDSHLTQSKRSTSVDEQPTGRKKNTRVDSDSSDSLEQIFTPKWNQDVESPYVSQIRNKTPSDLFTEPESDNPPPKRAVRDPIKTTKDSLKSEAKSQISRFELLERHNQEFVSIFLTTLTSKQNGKTSKIS